MNKLVNDYFIQFGGGGSMRFVFTKVALLFFCIADSTQQRLLLVYSFCTAKVWYTGESSWLKGCNYWRKTSTRKLHNRAAMTTACEIVSTCCFGLCENRINFSILPQRNEKDFLCRPEYIRLNICAVLSTWLTPLVIHCAVNFVIGPVSPF